MSIDADTALSIQIKLIDIVQTMGNESNEYTLDAISSLSNFILENTDDKPNKEETKETP